jgi:hypothetical protein
MDSLKKLLDKVDSIKDKITNQDYLELCNEARKVYDWLKLSEQKELKLLTLIHNVEEMGIVSDSDEELEDLEELDELKYQDQDQEQKNELKSEEKIILLECSCQENKFLCFFDDVSRRCNNYQTILQYCPAIARKYNPNAPKYTLPKNIINLSENSPDIINCIRYMINSFRHTHTHPEQINSIILCVLIMILNFSPEFNVEKFIEISSCKITEAITAYEKYKPETKLVLENYYDTTAEETIEIIKGWQKEFSKKLENIEISCLMNIDY